MAGGEKRFERRHGEGRRTEEHDAQRPGRVEGYHLPARESFRILRTINRDERVSMLIVEQNATLALELADRAYLMETGRMVMSGSASDLREHDTVRRAYLGY